MAIIKMTWDMTESQFNDFISDCHLKGENRNGPYSHSADYYGSVKIGDICVDLQHTLDPDSWYAFANVFILGIDDGYGYTNNGTPYSLSDFYPEVPIRCKSFASFKSKFGMNILKMIYKNPELKKYAYKTEGDWS